MIDRFVSVSIFSTSAILLRLIYFCFDIVIVLFWAGIIIPCKFLTPDLAYSFRRSLSDSKSPGLFLSILTDFNNAVDWLVSTRPLISKFPSPCTNPFVTVPSVPVTIGITVIFSFHRFFHSLARYSSLFLSSLSFTLWPARTIKSTIRKILFIFSFLSFFFFFFFLTISMSGRLGKIRWSVCISKSQKILCVSFSRSDSEFCKYHLFVWSN